MKVKFWGTRGSLPQAIKHDDLLTIIEEFTEQAKKKGAKSLADFSKLLKSGSIYHPLSYGGNTSCLEIAKGKDVAFVDMGTGLREAGTHYLAKGQKEFHIFLTHMHWDHVMGLPFFVPVHIPGHKIKIYHVHRNAPDFVKINFNGVNFPLTWEQLQGKIEFVQLKIYQKQDIGELAVTPFVLDHPGGCFGYRFESAGKSVTVGVDGEFKRVTQRDLGKDLPYFQNLDLLIFDAQYELSELASKFDWGHSSPTIGVDLALREGIRKLAFTHHDPWSDAEKLRRMNQNAQEHLNANLKQHESIWKKLSQNAGPELITAYDGLEISL